MVPPGPIATDLSLRSPIAPPSLSPIQSSAVPPPGFLNIDWRSGFADSNPQWLGACCRKRLEGRALHPGNRVILARPIPAR